MEKMTIELKVDDRSAVGPGVDGNHDSMGVNLAECQVRNAKKKKLTNPVNLENYFDQVWVINLERRRDRLDRFWKELTKSKWPFRQPKVFSAIEGDKVGVPKYWQTGGGSYGCLRSHLVILERAIQDNVQSILVLEDDAIFKNTFGTEVSEFLAKVPNDWQCLMLGGQHVNSTPDQVVPGVVRAGAGGGIQRTHCYGLRGYEIMKELYRTWANAAVHCDWVMGPCTAKFNTYAPNPFLAGQSDGKSDISGHNNPPKFWRSPSGTEPVIVLHAPRSVMEALRGKGWHGGFTRDSTTGIDIGLRDLFAETTTDHSARSVRLKQWIDMIQGEVVSMTEPAICTIWHSEARVEMIRPLVKGRTYEITAVSVKDALSQLPADIYKQMPVVVENIKLVLLRASRAVLDILRAEGWHNGHWRDEVTGQDNGIRRLFASTTDKSRRKAGLYDIIRTLHEEVENMSGGVVVLWHDEITPEMLDFEGIKVLEIVAASANEAKSKFEQLSNAKSTKSK